MREIKFRAWNKKNKEWSSEICLYHKTVGKRYEYNALKLDTDFDHVIVSQFTGLKDKNGKEIYEGDIIETKTDIFTIFYSEKDFEFIIYLERLDNYYRLTYLSGFKDFKCIGNIYENEDLL